MGLLRGFMASTEKTRFDRLRAMLLLSAIGGSLFVHYTFRVPFGFSLLIFFVGWPIVGTLITIDDDLKGGWSNPDGTVRAPWLEAPYWGQIAGGLALSLGGFAVDAGWLSAGGVRLWCGAAAAAFLAAALLTRRWWLLLGMSFGFVTIRIAG
jgi:hypothetical protein